MILKVHQISIPLKIAYVGPGDSTILVVSSRGRHMRSTPQLPLDTPEVDPKGIIKKGNLSQEGF
jgi:hypothetical protein